MWYNKFTKANFIILEIEFYKMTRFLKSCEKILRFSPGVSGLTLLYFRLLLFPIECKTICNLHTYIDEKNVTQPQKLEILNNCCMYRLKY